MFAVFISFDILRSLPSQPIYNSVFYSSCCHTLVLRLLPQGMTILVLFIKMTIFLHG